MAAFLGPEYPVPFSVSSERCNGLLLDRWKSKNIQRKIYKEYEDDFSNKSFGKFYTCNLCDVVIQYLDVDIDDALCYVGPDDGDLSGSLEARLSLINKIYCVGNSDPVALGSASNVTAEEFFNRYHCNEDAPKFDKIIVQDTLECVKDLPAFLRNIFHSLNSGGSMFLIYRPIDLFSLPISHSTKMKAAADGIDSKTLLRTFQSIHCDLEWDIVKVPIVIPRDKWKELLSNGYPNNLHSLPQYDIAMELRQLQQGNLKYMEELIELHDRLLVCRVRKELDQCTIRRFFGKSNVPKSNSDAQKKGLMQLRVQLEELPLYLRRTVERKLEEQPGKPDWLITTSNRDIS